MHAPGKGISQSALPYRRSVPTWLKLSSADVKEQIYKLAKKGLTPSQIGVILRYDFKLIFFLSFATLLRQIMSFRVPKDMCGNMLLGG